MSASAPIPDADPALPERLPLSYWLITGGTGPPPTLANYRRMALERKAAHREEMAHQADRAAAAADLKAQWGPTGLKAMVMSMLGRKTREKPGRRELMEKFGPGGPRRTRHGVGEPEAGNATGEGDGNGNVDENADSVERNAEVVTTGDGGNANESSAGNGTLLIVPGEGNVANE
ncbi:hypothetical protein F5Y19DRAFT_91166 [Xylariaceae sp. FL1651]|nr:hypothetical protein F5Y19DRAFT_91166 [Xylariaceae sp. FL1651]